MASVFFGRLVVGAIRCSGLPMGLFHHWHVDSNRYHSPSVVGAKSFAVVLTAFTNTLYLTQTPNPLKIVILGLELLVGTTFIFILLDIWQIEHTSSGFLTPSLKFKLLVTVAGTTAIQGLIALVGL